MLGIKKYSSDWDGQGPFSMAFAFLVVKGKVELITQRIANEIKSQRQGGEGRELRDPSICGRIGL